MKTGWRNIDFCRLGRIALGLSIPYALIFAVAEAAWGNRLGMLLSLGVLVGSALILWTTTCSQDEPPGPEWHQFPDMDRF